MVTVPKVSVSKFQSFLTSKEFIAVGSAVVITPLILNQVRSIVARTPLLQRNFTIGMVLIGFVIFIIAFMVSGFPRTILIGVGAGVAITTLAPIFEGNLKGVFS